MPIDTRLNKYRIGLSRLVYWNGSFHHKYYRTINVRASSEEEAVLRVVPYSASTGRCTGLEIAATDEIIEDILLIEKADEKERENG